MGRFDVRVQRADTLLPRDTELAWRIAAFATAARPVDASASAMVTCRLVDNAAVALASLARAPVRATRAQAMAHPRTGGATLFGVSPDVTVDAEWAAWANGTAVRELDYHDTYLAAEYAHPGDSLAPLLAVAQQCGCDGEALGRAALVAYEVHVALASAISLHAFKKDHVGHLAPASVAGIGALLGLATETVYQAVNQAVHLSFSTRQSRKGVITSWKACVPGFSGKLAIEAVDRAMRGEASPNPIYEGEDGVIAWMLGGIDSHYTVELPDPGEPALGILQTYTKAHSAEYQAQALIDLAFAMRADVDLVRVREVVLHTSHHTHFVIGTGANDPQKFDPDASRETLDHSIAYILAVALEDGEWHHERSYTPERAHRASTVALWQRIRTVEDPEWTRRYNDPDPARRAFGGRIEIVLDDGTVIEREQAVADAHPNGALPWGWSDYVGKFETLAAPVCDDAERARFLAAAERLRTLDNAGLRAMLPIASGDAVAVQSGQGIFDHHGERGSSLHSSPATP